VLNSYQLSLLAFKAVSRSFAIELDFSKQFSFILSHAFSGIPLNPFGLPASKL